MTVNIKSSVDSGVKVLSFLAPLTQITVDDELLEGLQALQASPAMMDYIQKKIDSHGGSALPAGVLAIEQVPDGVQQAVKLELKMDGSRLKKLFANLPAIIKFVSTDLPALIALVKGLAGGPAVGAGAT